MVVGTIQRMVSDQPIPVRLPGTPEAIAAGCTCPVDALVDDCPLHADPLSWEARQATKHFERIQIQRELAEGIKSPEQITREHQPWAQLGAVARYDLAKRLA